MQEHEKRLIKEYDDLVKKVNSLHRFIIDPDSDFMRLPVGHQLAMENQLAAMREYRDALQWRVDHIGKDAIPDETIQVRVLKNDLPEDMLTA